MKLFKPHTLRPLGTSASLLTALFVSLGLLTQSAIAQEKSHQYRIPLHGLQVAGSTLPPPGDGDDNEVDPPGDGDGDEGSSEYSCSFDGPRVIANEYRGQDIWMIVTGPSVSTVFADPSITIAGVSHERTYLSVGSSRVYVDAGYETLAIANNVPVVISGLDGKTATCRVDVISTEFTSDNDPNGEFNLDPDTGPAAGGNLVTLEVDEGVFLERDGLKPTVTVGDYTVPTAQVQFVSSTAVAFTMPAASVVGATKRTPEVWVSVRNAGSLNEAYAEYTFTDFPVVAPPANHNAVAWWFSDKGIAFVSLESCAQKPEQAESCASPFKATNLEWEWSYGYVDGMYRHDGEMETDTRGEYLHEWENRWSGFSINDGVNAYSFVNKGFTRHQYFEYQYVATGNHNCSTLRAAMISGQFYPEPWLADCTTISMGALTMQITFEPGKGERSPGVPWGILPGDDYWTRAIACEGTGNCEYGLILEDGSVAMKIGTKSSGGTTYSDDWNVGPASGWPLAPLEDHDSGGSTNA